MHEEERSFPHNPEDRHKLPIHDVVQGALYDKSGLAFVLFTRFREGGFIDILRVMAQSANRRVYHVKDVEVKGILRKRFVIQMENEIRQRFEFSPTEIRDSYDDSVDKVLASADMYAKSPEAKMGGFMPPDFWGPLTEAKWLSAVGKFVS